MQQSGAEQSGASGTMQCQCKYRRGLHMPGGQGLERFTLVWFGEWRLQVDNHYDDDEHKQRKQQQQQQHLFLTDGSANIHKCKHVCACVCVSYIYIPHHVLLYFHQEI